MKTFRKKAIALLLAFTLAFSAPAAVFAQDTARKSEVVYAKMLTDGKITDVLVVNGFEKNPGTLVDYGAYEKVINLTNADPVEKVGDRIEIRSEEAPFFYQGKMRDPQLPWNIAITYRLNDKEIKAEELVGQTGKMAMEIAVTKNPKAEKAFAENYLLQIMVNLDAARFKGIEAKGGTIASQGETRLVTFTLMPGKEQQFALTAEGTEIELGMVQIAGMPFSMEFEVPDLSEYTGDLVQLQDAIAKLSDGVDEFTDGVGSIYNASGELRSGAGELSGAANDLSSGLSRLSSGMADYEKGLEQYVEALEQGVDSMTANIPDFDMGGLQALVDGSAQLANGIGQFDRAMQENLGENSQFAQGLNAVTAGAQELSRGLSLFMYGNAQQPGILESSAQIQNALSQISAGLSAGMPGIDMEGITQLTEGLSQLEAGLGQCIAVLDQALAGADPTVMQNVIEGLYTLKGTLTAVIENLRNPVIDGIDLSTVAAETNPEAYGLMQAMQRHASVIEEQCNSVDAAIATMEQFAQLFGGLVGIRTALSEMLSGIQSAITQLSSFDLLQMMGQMGELIAGMQQLSSQYDLFHAGLTQGLTQIARGLDNPSKENPGLVQGLLGLQSGFKELSKGLLAGSAALVPGAVQLSLGIASLAKELAAMAENLDFGEELQQLITGSRSLLQGHRELTAGMQTLNTGMKEYASGVVEYARGVVQFQRGMLTLSNGGWDLASGMHTFRNETGDMDEQMQDRIDEMLDEFMPKDFTPISFASSKNKEVAFVQFVYMTEGLKMEKAEEPQIQQEEPKGILDKIFDLFR